MYRPAQFREDDPSVLDAFVTAHPLGALVTSGADGLIANHIPMQLTRTADGVRLRGHIARANDLWKTVAPASRVVVLFGGAQRYITPSWYPTKQATGEVVPTWNYCVVHAHGAIRFFDDREELHALVTVLTDHHEASRKRPWAVGDAPAPYIDGMLRAIVGFDIAVDRLEGKFKASQNRNPADRDGVAQGMLADGVDTATREELVRQR